MTHMIRRGGTRPFLAAAAVAAAVAGTAGAAPLIVGGNYLETRNTSCSLGLTCPLGFTPVPAGSTVTYRNLNCSWTGTSPRVFTLSGRIGSTTDYFVNSYAVTDDVRAARAINLAVLTAEFGAPVPAGGIARITAHFDSSLTAKFTMICTLAGTIV